MPTARARAGDLGEYGIPIFDPATGDPSVRQPFPGNVIPPARLSPQALNILSLIPMPNADGRDNGTRENYVASGSEKFDGDAFNVRMDGRLAKSVNVFGRYSLAHFTRDGPTAFGEGGGPALVSLGGTSVATNQSLALGFDSTLSPSTLRRRPARILPLQGGRAADRLRHHRGPGRGNPEHELRRLQLRPSRGCRRRTQSAISASAPGST